MQIIRTICGVSGAFFLLAACGGSAPATDDAAQTPSITVPVADLDGDGLPDSSDDDRDGDGLANAEEIARGTNPDSADTEGDGVNDGSDNCAVMANADQADTDADGTGDVCSPDDDGDGLSDGEEQAVYHTNPQRADSDSDGWNDAYETLTSHTDPLRVDTDGDQVTDSVDHFPLDPAESADQDGDGIGDHADNCPTVVNPDQQNSEARYAALNNSLLSAPVQTDQLGDACDADRDGDGLSVTYVDAQAGDDAQLGTFAEPVKTLTRGLALAAQYGDELWLAPGDYAWPAVLSPSASSAPITIRGGRKAGTTDVPHPYHQAEDALTIIVTAKDGAAVSTQFNGAYVRLDHVWMAANSGDLVMQLHGGQVTCQSCALEMQGGRNVTGILVDGGGDLQLLQSVIDMDLPGTLRPSAIGVDVENGSATIQNSVILVRQAESMIGLLAGTKSAVTMQQSDLIVTSPREDLPQSAYGAVLRAPVTMQNNLIMTLTADDQAGVVCDAADLSLSTITGNAISVFWGQGPQPVAIDCAGNYVTADSSDVTSLQGQGLELKNSRFLSDVDPSDLIQQPNSEEMPFAPLDARIKYSTEPASTTTQDLYGRLRHTPFAIGAVEP